MIKPQAIDFSFGVAPHEARVTAEITADSRSVLGYTILGRFTINGRLTLAPRDAAFYAKIFATTGGEIIGASMGENADILHLPFKIDRSDPRAIEPDVNPGDNVRLFAATVAAALIGNAVEGEAS